MLFKIPQNIIISLSFCTLGFGLVWFSIFEDVSIRFEGSHSLLDTAAIKSANWLKLLVITLSGICAFVVLQINKMNRLVEGSSIPFILFTSIGFSTCLISNISIVDTFAVMMSLVSLSLILRIHNQNSVLGLLLLSSLLLGGATILFYPSFILFLTALLTLAFFRPLEIRNYLVILVGLLLTSFYLFTVSFLLDWDLQLLKVEFTSFENIASFESSSIPLITFSIFSLIGALKMFSDRAKFIVRQRNQLVVISSYILIQTLLSLMLGVTVIWISIVPVFSIFLVYYYKTSARKWLLDAVTLLFIIALIWLKF